MVEELFVVVAGQNRVFKFSELDQAVQGAPQGDGVPARVAAVKQAGTDAGVDCLDDEPDNLAAVAIDFAFQIWCKENFRRGEKVINDIVVIPAFFTEAYVLPADLTQFFVGRQVPVAGFEYPGKENFQTFFLEIGKDLFFTPVIEVDGAHAQFSLFGDLIDGGGVQAFFEKQSPGSVQNLIPAGFFFAISSFFQSHKVNLLPVIV